MYDTKENREQSCQVVLDVISIGRLLILGRWHECKLPNSASGVTFFFYCCCYFVTWLQTSATEIRGNRVKDSCGEAGVRDYLLDEHLRCVRRTF